MADVTQEQVVEYIKGISVLELSQLVKALEEELGVSAAAAMPMAVAGAVARREQAAVEHHRDGPFAPTAAVRTHRQATASLPCWCCPVFRC